MRALLLFSILLLSSVPIVAQNLLVSGIRVESKVDPAGVERAVPRLSWELTSGRRGVKQRAYRVLVADREELLKQNVGNIWDSRKVLSSASIQVPYGGKPLLPAKTYFWKVMAWDNQSAPSPWSAPARWQMGLPGTKDWQGARWIGYERLADSLVSVLPVDGKKDKYSYKNIIPLFRKEFSLQKEVKKATMFISGLGHFELYINGQKIGDHFLDPGWTKYDKQAQYVAFDVTDGLRKGPNAIGVWVGNGFYYIPPVSGRYRKLRSAFGFPKMISRLLIEYTDGATSQVVSDGTWKTAKSPISFSSIYGGEDYNAGLEQKGWSEPGFDQGSWKDVVLVDGSPLLTAQLQEPVKVMDTFRVRKSTSPARGKWVFDLGQNASGIPQISVRGKRGDTVRIYPAELLKDDGTITQKASGGPYYLEYILKGEGVETWQPRFTYYGYRYLQVEGAVPREEANPGELPVLVDVKGLHIRNAASTIGTFQSSSELFNRTFSLIDWAIRSNTVSVFTDCPHREKLGWLEQAHLMGNSVRLTYDVVNLFRKQVGDMRHSQTEEGLIPEIAPEYVKFEWGGDMFRDSPEWGSNAIIIPWYLFQWYGDTSVLRESYGVMQHYASYLKGKAKGHILKQGLGDWYDLGPKAPGVSQLTPMGVTGTAMYYYDLTILGKVARLLGKGKDASGYAAEAAKVRRAFNDTFFHKDTRQYASGSQAANAMAVYMGLVEPQHRSDVVQNIVADIRSRNNSLTAGDIGYRYLLQVLQESGRSDVIFDMNSRSDVPGYGYQLAKGATALTESWAALPTNSNNHFMLGHLMEWFYKGLGGISQSENSVAYREIVISPQIVGDVEWTKASYRSPYGLISSEWRKTESGLLLHVTIPVNTKASIILPAKKGARILEGGRPLNGGPVKVLGWEEGMVRIQVPSGSYAFAINN